MKKPLWAFLCLLCLLTARPASGQVTTKLDSLFKTGDTTAILDSLLEGFDSFLDSISKPKSQFYIGLGFGTGFYTSQSNSSVYLNTQKKLMFSPSIGYLHKSGLGLSVQAYSTTDNNKFSFYQGSISPSYDLIRSGFSSGLAYSRFFTKDSVSFYTTPIQNELYAYFSYKKWWVRPTISVSYGWGSKTSYEQQKQILYLRRLQTTRSYYVNVKNTENIQDFSVLLSVRKNFDFEKIFGKNDLFTLTPVLMLSMGTQMYGFNTSYSSSNNIIRANALPSNSDISDQSNFALQSASAIIRGSYMTGKLLIQPQVLFDYYLVQGASEPFTIVYSLNCSIAF